MASSLKEANRLALYSVLMTNLAVYFAAVQTNVLFGGQWLGLAKSLPEALPAGLGLIAAGVFNAQISAGNKARIVFFRWNHALPGCRAFSHHAKNDPRIDLVALGKAFGHFPSEPREQNTLWYRLYKSVEDDPSVIQVHRAFLFTRDYTCLAMLMRIVLGGAGFIQISSQGTALGWLGLLILQFVVAGQAARDHGKRFVQTVLAIKGTEHL